MPELPVVPEKSPSTGGSGPLPAGRYGRTAPRLSPRATRVLLSVVGVVVVALVGWFAFSQPGNDVRGKDVGFSVTSPELVSITFDVAKPKDATVVCELEALSSSYAQVGVREVTIGPSDIAEARFTVEIATSEKAVTAVVKSCRTAE